MTRVLGLLDDSDGGSFSSVVAYIRQGLSNEDAVRAVLRDLNPTERDIEVDPEDMDYWNHRLGGG